MDIRTINVLDVETNDGSSPQRPLRFGLNRIRKRLWDCRISLISVLLGLTALTLVAPVQDLLLEIKGLRSIIGFAIIVLVFWTIPVHNAASRAIRHIKRPSDPAHKATARWAMIIDRAFPPLLGFATLFVFYFAVGRIAQSLDTNTGIPAIESAVEVLRTAQICIVGAAVVFVPYMVWHERVITHRPQTFIGGILHAMPTALGLFTFIVLAVAILDPSEFVWQMGREDLLPVMFGGWVPLFSYLALLSRRTGWPVTILVAVALVVLTAFAGRFHDVRTFKSALWQQAQTTGAGHLERQVPFDEAVASWMAANGCSGDAEKCPPVVLIAAAGGGSRAAFYTGTIIGALLDATRADPARYHDIGKAIFAMSGVSGGALGVTVARTALADAIDGKPPCRYSEDNWFGRGIREKAPRESWRACLQLLSAGDYLSPALLGAAARDSLSFLVSLVTGEEVPDRAVLLEQAMERHYNNVVFGERTSCGGGEDRRGLCRPFGYLDLGDHDHWLPLLFLDATSAHTGGQIIVPDLRIGADSPDSEHCTEVYPFSLSVFEIMASSGVAGQPAGPAIEGGCTYSGLARADDIRLSTAVVISARFPLLSPQGNLRNRDGTVVAQVLDGGFFDNTGLEGLMPLIPLLGSAGLHPLVVQIDNQPWGSEPGNYAIPGRPIGRDEPRYVKVNNEPQSSWTDDFDSFVTLGALNSTRKGHEARVEDEAIQLVTEDAQGLYVSPRLYPVTRPPQIANSELCDEKPNLRFSLRNLTMSWWLSPLLQEVIDYQLCDPRDALLLRDVLAGMAIQAPAPATGAPTNPPDEIKK